MPLGIGRASEYAGWWTGKPRMATTLTANLDYADPWLVTPRYYQANAATGYALANYGVPGSSGVGQINTTGLTNTANYTTAITIRFGTDYLVTAPNNTEGFLWYDQYTNAGTAYFPYVGLNKTSTGAYQWTANGSVGAIITNFDTGWRNTWLTFILAVSTSSSSFANWTGSGTGSYYGRIAVVNAQTGQLTQSFTDLVVGGTVVTKDFSQNWYFNGSSYAYGPFVYCPNGDWDLYGRTDWDLASIWHGWNVLDPAVYYSQLSGAAMSPTVGGLNSTFMCQFAGAGTRNSPSDNGFSIAFGANGSRMPSDVIWTTNTNQGTSTNSSALVSF
jgi:hypothetical protein